MRLSQKGRNIGNTVLSFQPGHIGGNWIGGLEIAGACLSWGIDNNLTQRVSLRDPVAVARIKTLAAGSCVLAIAYHRPDLSSCNWITRPLAGTLPLPDPITACPALTLDLLSVKDTLCAASTIDWSTPAIGTRAARC